MCLRPAVLFILTVMYLTAAVHRRLLLMCMIRKAFHGSKSGAVFQHWWSLPVPWLCRADTREFWRGSIAWSLISAPPSRKSQTKHLEKKNTTGKIVSKSAGIHRIIFLETHSNIGFCIHWQTYRVQGRQISMSFQLNSVVFGTRKCQRIQKPVLKSSRVTKYNFSIEQLPSIKYRSTFVYADRHFYYRNCYN